MEVSFISVNAGIKQSQKKQIEKLLSYALLPLEAKARRGIKLAQASAVVGEFRTRVWQYLKKNDKNADWLKSVLLHENDAICELATLKGIITLSNRPRERRFGRGGRSIRDRTGWIRDRRYPIIVRLREVVKKMDKERKA